MALNGEPVYLQLALDQAYHPEGFYTFPSDAFVRDEVLRARQIGLNGLREHVKVEAPRKLYWADRLGVLDHGRRAQLVGRAHAEMRQEIEATLRQMIQRDYNHPSIFSWIPFNETWGLFTNVPRSRARRSRSRSTVPETQKWVASVYRLAKSLDATRLVEDNSVCCGRGHTETDLNSWHDYLPGWAWDEELDKVSQGTASRLDLELRERLQAGPPAQHQQRVRQRVGLRRLDGRRGLELGLPPRGQRVPPPSEGRGLALHRAPRRHQRVERLLALRPHARSSRAWRTSPPA